jgi:phosphoglycolate/pyridoxal phosphate phosphatase family enzyme
MDGVLYLGESPIPGAVQTIALLQSAGKQVYFLTNNSGQTRAAYIDKLARMGIHTDAAHMYTSGYATAIYLSERGSLGSSAFIIGEYGIASELDAVGMRTVTRTDDLPYSEIDYVVVGIDKNFTYDKLRFGHAAITRGHAQFIATNRDATFPLEEGAIPGGGSLVAALATAAGCEPLVIGKPEPYALDAILRAAGVAPEVAVMVGDRMDTDIAAGKRLNVPTVLVTTGVTTAQDAASAPKSLQPERIIGNLMELLEGK